MASRDQALLGILRSARLCTEDGREYIVDFDERHSDRLDFTSISRSNLRRLLTAAYEAGHQAR